MSNETRKLAIYWLVIINIFALHVYRSIGQTDPVFTADGAMVRLAWDANSEPDVSYYTAYWYRADSAGVLGTVYHPATTAAFTLPMKRLYERYTFSLTATDQAGNQSDHSATVAGIFGREPVLYGDVNDDGFVDIEDWTIIYLRRGSKPWYVNWSDKCDLNGDGLIDIEDNAICYDRKGDRL